MIHSSKIHVIVQQGEFSIAFVAESGEVISSPRVICTSFHSKGRTMNLKFCDSGQIRTVRRCTIIEINNQKVYL